MTDVGSATKSPLRVKMRHTSKSGFESKRSPD